MIIAAMLQEEIRVGDVVALAAGGPEMTVQARSQNLAYCAWLEEGQLHQGTFEIEGLRLLRRPPAPVRRAGR